MNTDFYVNQIEDRMTDLDHNPQALDPLRDEIQADPNLTEYERQNLLDRIGQYVASQVYGQP